MPKLLRRCRIRPCLNAGYHRRARGRDGGLGGRILNVRLDAAGSRARSPIAAACAAQTACTRRWQPSACTRTVPYGHRKRRPSPRPGRRTEAERSDAGRPHGCSKAPCIGPGCAYVDKVQVPTLKLSACIVVMDNLPAHRSAAVSARPFSGEASAAELFSPRFATGRRLQPRSQPDRDGLLQVQGSRGRGGRRAAAPSPNSGRPSATPARHLQPGRVPNRPTTSIRPCRSGTCSRWPGASAKGRLLRAADRLCPRAVRMEAAAGGRVGDVTAPVGGCIAPYAVHLVIAGQMRLEILPGFGSASPRSQAISTANPLFALTRPRRRCGRRWPRSGASREEPASR